MPRRGDLPRRNQPAQDEEYRIWGMRPETCFTLKTSVGAAFFGLSVLFSLPATLTFSLLLFFMVNYFTLKRYQSRNRPMESCFTCITDHYAIITMFIFQIFTLYLTVCAFWTIQTESDFYTEREVGFICFGCIITLAVSWANFKDLSSLGDMIIEQRNTRQRQ